MNQDTPKSTKQNKHKHITGRMTMMSAQTDTAYIIVTGTTDMNLLLLEVSSC